jgi:hypothetical protein
MGKRKSKTPTKRPHRDLVPPSPEAGQLARIDEMLPPDYDGPARIDFVYELCGDLKDVNVFELAPTLSSLGTLFQEASRTLFPDGAPVETRVRPFRKGSFLVDLGVGTIPEAAGLLAALGPTGLHQLVEVLTDLGFLWSKGKNGVLKVMEVLGKKPTKVEKLPKGRYRYKTEDTSIDVDGNVHNLLQNPTININIYDSLAKPVERGTAKEVKVRQRGSRRQPVKITKTKVPAIKEFASGPLPGTQEERTVENETVVFLNPARGPFYADGHQWGFRNGNQTIPATIKDKNFLEKYGRGDYRLNHADLLKVRLKEKQKIVGTEVKSTSYEILEVLEQAGRTAAVPAGS